MSELDKIRENINNIDEQMAQLFQERMEMSRQVAVFKKDRGLSIRDAERERELIDRDRRFIKDPAVDGYYVQFLRSVLDLSCAYQSRLLNGMKVAYSGVEGAYGYIAARRMFPEAQLIAYPDFAAAHRAVEQGEADSAVLPLENSTAGSVNAVYDLMTQHNFRIVRSVRIKVDHNLLANPGAKLENIREIYSHEQAISQCAHFLQGFPNVKVIRCENTAVAARMVAESGRDDVAALSSRACRELYGLDCLAASVQDQGNNFTRFSCIAKNLEIYPGADRTSLMMVLPHHPGSLYKVLSRVNALGVNMNQLESRPMPDRNFEFMFYFDLETSVYAPQFTQLMGELPELCEEFTYLGSYSEVV